MYGSLPIESELYQAMMLASTNRRDEALQLAQALLRKGAAAQPAVMSGIAEVLATCGQSTAASRIASDYDLFSANSPISRFRQALPSLSLNNSSEALSLLGAAYQEREAELIWLASDPRLDALRKDSRFVMLLDNVAARFTERAAV